jgi:malonyl-CoA O-methyltransferase
VIDSALARRRFSRAATTYATASRLESEIGARLIERLDYVKLSPGRILDLGCGPGREARALQARFSAAQLWLVDFALPMLRVAQPPKGLLARLAGRRGAVAVCADFARLPFPDGSVELAVSNMALHWARDPLAALREWHRVLAVDGLLMFSTLGPDTLRELRAAAGGARVHAFADMHDVGDMLGAAGYAAPVMDMEQLTVLYADSAALLADLRASGQTCALAARRRGLSGRGFRAALDAALGRRLREGRLPVTYEVVYGHAWKPAAARAADGRAIVRFERRAPR